MFKRNSSIRISTIFVLVTDSIGSGSMIISSADIINIIMFN